MKYSVVATTRRR